MINIIIQIREIIAIIFLIRDDMAKPKTISTSNDKKAVAWKIPTVLRHWLNSHAAYLSATGDEVSTDDMVTQWLSDRLKAEEKNRDHTALETALNRVLDSNQ